MIGDVLLIGHHDKGFHSCRKSVLHIGSTFPPNRPVLHQLLTEGKCLFYILLQYARASLPRVVVSLYSRPLRRVLSKGKLTRGACSRGGCLGLRTHTIAMEEIARVQCLQSDRRNSSELYPRKASHHYYALGRSNHSRQRTCLHWTCSRLGPRRASAQDLHTGELFGIPGFCLWTVREGGCAGAGE